MYSPLKPEGAQCKIADNYYKIGLRGMVFLWSESAKEWFSSTKERKVVEYYINLHRSSKRYKEDNREETHD